MVENEAYGTTIASTTSGENTRICCYYVREENNYVYLRPCEELCILFHNNVNLSTYNIIANNLVKYKTNILSRDLRSPL